MDYYLLYARFVQWNTNHTLTRTFSKRHEAVGWWPNDDDDDDVDAGVMLVMIPGRRDWQ